MYSNKVLLDIANFSASSRAVLVAFHEMSWSIRVNLSKNCLGMNSVFGEYYA